METNGEGVSEQPSQELWHSLDFDQVVLVHIEVVPGLIELLGEVVSGLIVIVLEVGVDDLVGDGSGGVLIEEEMA